jgi:hypothetical protein
MDAAAMQLPFAHLNLTRNPFGEATEPERIRLAVADVDAVVARLGSPGNAVQFLGEKGRGKTSHLMAIRSRFPEAPYVHVREREWPRIPRGHPLLLDETQRLPAWRRRLLFRRPVSFAIGTHEDHTWELLSAGLEVETLRPGESTDVERLDAIVRRRIEWARRGPGPVPGVPRPALERLLEAAGDDLRKMQDVLYGAFQHAREVGDVEL